MLGPMLCCSEFGELGWGKPKRTLAGSSSLSLLALVQGFASCKFAGFPNCRFAGFARVAGPWFAGFAGLLVCWVCLFVGLLGSPGFPGR